MNRDGEQKWSHDNRPTVSNERELRIGNDTDNFEFGKRKKNSGEGEAIQESHTRSILKGITWQIVATLTTMMIAWIVIGDIGDALQIGFFEFIIKIVIYYFHERVWAKIPV